MLKVKFNIQAVASRLILHISLRIHIYADLCILFCYFFVYIVIVLTDILLSSKLLHINLFLRMLVGVLPLCVFTRVECLL